MSPATRAWAGRIAVLAAIVLLLVCAVFLVRHLIAGTKGKKHTIPQISLLKPPPPPPPKEEKPPEPIKKEEVKIEQPKPNQPDEPKSEDNKPVGKDLGLDGDANGGPDGFGMVARRGGTDLLATGGGSGGGSRAQFSVFTSSAQQVLHEEIKKRLKEKSRDFRANYKIWLDGEGNIKRFEITPTGIAEVDQDLRAALADVHSLNLAPPPDLPQPLRFQFTLRPAG